MRMYNGKEKMTGAALKFTKMSHIMANVEREEFIAILFKGVGVKQQKLGVYLADNANPYITKVASFE